MWSQLHHFWIAAQAAGPVLIALALMFAAACLVVSGGGKS